MGVFEQLAGRLDLTRACAIRSPAFDNLPPTPADLVGDDVARRIAERLDDALAQGRYRPAPAYLTAVAKTSGSPRLVAVLSLWDGALYQALVDRLMPAMSAAYDRPGVLFGTGEFRYERVPFASPAASVVLADVADSYQSVSRPRLMSMLRAASPEHAVVSALDALLDGVSAGEGGLPQLGRRDTSLYLSTFYLAPVDRAMVDSGWHFARRGDDMMIVVDRAADADRALALLTDELGKLDLRLNSAKTEVLPMEQYRRRIESWEQAGSLPGVTPLVLHPWSSQRSPMAVLADARRHLPAGVRRRLAQRVFARRANDALEDLAEWAASGPPGDVVDPEFACNVRALVRLQARARHAGCLPYVGGLLQRFPSVVPAVADYLCEMVPLGHRHAVVDAVEDAIASGLPYPAQEAWLLRVLQTAPDRLSPPMLQRLAVWSVGGDWVRRVEALGLLGARGELERAALDDAWATAPVPLRADLLALLLRGHRASWAAAFVDDHQDDPVVDLFAEARSAV